jgi:hypothetical protein
MAFFDYKRFFEGIRTCENACFGQFSIQCRVLKVFIYSKTSRQRPTALNPSPKLSTVVQSAYKIGTRTARILLDQLERKQKMKDFEKIVLQTYLKIS